MDRKTNINLINSSLLTDDQNKGKPSYQVKITKENKAGNIQSKQLNVGTNLINLNSSNVAMAEVQNFKELDIICPRESGQPKISNISIEFEHKVLRKSNEHSMRVDSPLYSSDLSMGSRMEHLKNSPNLFDNYLHKMAMPKDQSKQFDVPKNISLKIKLNAEKKIIEKRQNFQQNEKHMSLPLDISNEESSLRNIKDYLNLLSNIQKWELENEKIIEDNLEYLDQITEDVIEKSYRHINNVFQDKLDREEKLGERKSLRTIKPQSEINDQIELPLNVLNPDVQSTYENPNDMQEMDIEIKPISNCDITNFLQKFEGESRNIEPKSRMSAVNHDQHSMSTIRVFNKSSVDQFEWFVDNVFAISDKNSVISEKTTDVTNARNKKAKSGDQCENETKTILGTLKKEESIYPLDAQEKFEVDSIYSEQLLYHSLANFSSKRNIDNANQSFVSKVENFFTNLFCLPCKKNTEKEFKKDEI